MAIQTEVEHGPVYLRGRGKRSTMSNITLDQRSKCNLIIILEGHSDPILRGTWEPELLLCDILCAHSP